MLGFVCDVRLDIGCFKCCCISEEWLTIAFFHLHSEAISENEVVLLFQYKVKLLAFVHLIQGGDFTQLIYSFAY